MVVALVDRGLSTSFAAPERLQTVVLRCALGAGAFGLAFVLGATWVETRRHAKRLAEARRLARRYRQYDFSRSPEFSSDIGRVAEVFEAAARELGQRLLELT